MWDIYWLYQNIYIEATWLVKLQTIYHKLNAKATLTSSMISRARNRITSRLARFLQLFRISYSTGFRQKDRNSIFKALCLKYIWDYTIWWLYHCCADPLCGERLWCTNYLISNKKITCFFSTLLARSWITAG